MPHHGLGRVLEVPVHANRIIIIIRSNKGNCLQAIFVIVVVLEVMSFQGLQILAEISLGHWIHDCPTNSDPNFDKKRIRRTTGIPRSMLEAVEKPTEGGAPLAQGVMVTPDGGYVIARPDL